VCWSEYVRLVPEFQFLDRDNVREVVKSFRTIHEHKIFPTNGMFPEWTDDIPVNVRNQIIKHSLNSIDPLTFDEVAKTHQIGAKAKRAIANIMPLLLFSIQLPILAPEHMDEWLSIADYIADVVEAGQSWHSFIESQTSPREIIRFYREMLTILNGGKQTTG